MFIILLFWAENPLTVVKRQRLNAWAMNIVHSVPSLGRGQFKDQVSFIPLVGVMKEYFLLTILFFIRIIEILTCLGRVTGLIYIYYNFLFGCRLLTNRCSNFVSLADFIDLLKYLLFYLVVCLVLLVAYPLPCISFGVWLTISVIAVLFIQFCHVTSLYVSVIMIVNVTPLLFPSIALCYLCFRKYPRVSHDTKFSLADRFIPDPSMLSTRKYIRFGAHTYIKENSTYIPYLGLLGGMDDLLSDDPHTIPKTKADKKELKIKKEKIDRKKRNAKNHTQSVLDAESIKFNNRSQKAEVFNPATLNITQAHSWLTGMYPSDAFAFRPVGDRYYVGIISGSDIHWYGPSSTVLPKMLSVDYVRSGANFNFNVLFPKPGRAANKEKDEVDFSKVECESKREPVDMSVEFDSCPSERESCSSEFMSTVMDVDIEEEVVYVSCLPTMQGGIFKIGNQSVSSIQFKIFLCLRSITNIKTINEVHLRSLLTTSTPAVWLQAMFKFLHPIPKASADHITMYLRQAKLSTFITNTGERPNLKFQALDLSQDMIVLGTYTLSKVCIAFLVGGARGSEHDIGYFQKVIQTTPDDDTEPAIAWAPDAFPDYNLNVVPLQFAGQQSQSYQSLFMNSIITTQLTSGLSLKLNSIAGAYIGARFMTTLIHSADAGFVQPTYYHTHLAILFQQKLNPVYKAIGWNEAYSSLAAINPASTFAAVASANRSYANTPYGELSVLAALFRTRNVYVQEQRVCMFNSFVYMIQFAFMCEPGSFDTNHRGKWPLDNGLLQFSYSSTTTPRVMVPFSTAEVDPNLVFITLANFVNGEGVNRAYFNSLYSTGAVAFIGGGVGKPSAVSPESFIMQLLALGAKIPAFAFATSLQTDTNANNLDGQIFDVAYLYKKAVQPQILVIVGSNNTPASAGPNNFNTMVAYQLLALSSIAGPIIAYSCTDFIGSYVTMGGFNFWHSAIMQLCMSWGTGEDYNDAMFYAMHNFSLSTNDRNVTGFINDAGVSAQNFGGVARSVAFLPTDPVAPGSYTLQLANGLTTPVIVSIVNNPYLSNLTAESLQAYLPIPSGMEYLVIAGFARMAQSYKPQRVADQVFMWSSRYWYGEALSQAYTELHRQILYTFDLYSTAVPDNSYSEMYYNLYNSLYGPTSSHGMLPAVAPLIKYYKWIVAQTVTPAQMYYACSFFMKQNILTAVKSRTIHPSVRPEFLVNISNYVSPRFRLFSASPTGTNSIPRLTSSEPGSMNVAVVGVAGSFLHYPSQPSTTSVNFEYNRNLLIPHYTSTCVNSHEYIAVQTLAQSTADSSTLALTNTVFPAVGPLCTTATFGVQLSAIALSPYSFGLGCSIAVRPQPVYVNATIVSPNVILGMLYSTYQAIIPWIGQFPFDYNVKALNLKVQDKLLEDADKSIIPIVSTTGVNPLSEAALGQPEETKDLAGGQSVVMVSQ